MRLVLAPVFADQKGSLHLDVSEQGATVYIDGTPARDAGHGEYARTIVLVPGLNRIALDALDAAGNATHVTSYVTRRVQLGQNRRP